MSWKLVKKLEEAHIDTVVKSPPISTMSLPGVLTVTLHEGVGFTAPNQYKERLNSDEHSHSPPGRRPANCQRCNYPYALLEYEKSQASLDCYFGTTENPMWKGYLATCKFDVPYRASLTISLYLRDPNGSMKSEDILLGVARLDPFGGLGKSEDQWLTVQDGTGKIRISVDYENTSNKTLGMGDFQHLGFIGKGGLGYVAQAKKKDTQRTYAEKIIRLAEFTSSEITRAQASRIDNPFIAPLIFAFETEKDLHLLSPFVSGGHLFHHLQRERCFNADRARIYAAEILCALEYLHGAHGISSWLKPRNVLLDSVGHIVLCKFGLFISQIKNSDRTIHGTLEYPPPEMLLGQDGSRMADWWTLGVFLYEMLTGLPPFYDNDPNEIRRNILNQPVKLPEALSFAAKDMIAKLLDRHPAHRLGANGGASEIKAHAFFDGVDWQQIIQRQCKPTFRPGYIAKPFKEHAVTNLREQWAGFSYNRPALEKSASNARTDSAVISQNLDATVKEEDGWELVWEEAPLREFRFYNPTTREKQPVPPRAIHPYAPKDVTDSDSSDSDFPIRSQKQDALEAALQAGHDHATSQLLEYGMDLDIFLFGGDRKSPLQWATEHENVGLVRLFLDKGADVNFPTFAMRQTHEGGPSLIKAVEKGNQELTELLVRKTSRVASTRALGLAVDRRDVPMVRLLLAYDVRCDFEEGDRPLPKHPLDEGCYFYDLSEPEEFAPPLARAVKQGNVDMARLLLSHGADVNAPYHDLRWSLVEMSQREELIMFSCGRVVELAMQLKQPEMVQLLLAGGARIDLPQPVWPVPGHGCAVVPRGVYQRVMADLRAAVVSRKESTADTA
ncbi:protein kinase [Dactylonectria macrodidyma]|uniref:Protein kinase n=1 Tax=Dactylonectria macrodidyma TaxID=307937 RepID=A0A9P9E778_9HYPO|nr:protein kinase [Dactylonectria macrodidyma]